MVAGTVLFPPSVHRSLSMCDGLLFDLIRSWFEFLTVCQARYHAHHATEPFFAFDLFPLYYLQIHALLPSVHHSILQQLSCGLARRQGQPTPTEYIKSGMKARWPQGLEFTRSCFLLSSPNWATQLVEMILCHCNVFVVTDVNICRGWGIPRFCSHRRLQVPRSVDGRIAEPAFSLHPQRLRCEPSWKNWRNVFLATPTRRPKTRRFRTFCRRVGVGGNSDGSDYVADEEEGEYLWNTLTSQGILNPTDDDLFFLDSDALDGFEIDETPVMKLPTAFCYSLLFRALQVVLNQDQLLVLKKGLLFVYHHADLFIGQHRKDVGKER